MNKIFRFFETKYRNLYFNQSIIYLYIYPEKNSRKHLQPININDFYFYKQER